MTPEALANLQTGDPFVYSSGSNDPIGGLTSGATYFLIVPTDLTDEVQLAASLADAEAGTFIPFTQYPTLTAGSISVPVSVVDQTDGTITFASNPGFTDGEKVTYHAVQGELIGGLADGGTYYAIVNAASPDTLQLSATAPVNGVDGTPIPLNLDPVLQGFRQSLPVTVNPSGGPANSIRFGFNAGFTLGDSFIYQGSGISGLDDGVRYWAIPDSNNADIIQLADSYADAQAGTPLAIGSNAPGGLNGSTLVFDPSILLDGDANTIDLGFNYALAGTLPSGTPLVYRGAMGQAVPGLTDGTTYYVIQDMANPRLMRLTAASASQAIAAAEAGDASYNTQYQAAYQPAYNAYLQAHPGDTTGADAAGTAAAQSAASQAGMGEDWVSPAIDPIRVGDAPATGSFAVTVNPAGQPVAAAGTTVDFGLDYTFDANEPLVYEGPAPDGQGILGLTPGDVYKVTLPDRVDDPGLVAFLDGAGNPVTVSLASGTTTNAMFGAPTTENVTVTPSQINFNNPYDPGTNFDPGLTTGQAFVYLGPQTSSDTAISGLTPGQVYYVIATGTPGVIQLATSYQNATAPKPVPITTLTTSTITTNINAPGPAVHADRRSPAAGRPVRDHRQFDDAVTQPLHVLAQHADAPGLGRCEYHGRTDRLRELVRHQRDRRHALELGPAPQAGGPLPAV